MIRIYWFSGIKEYRFKEIKINNKISDLTGII
jgi:hypothetical protein